MPTFLHISDTHISGDPAYHPSWIPPTAPHPNRAVEALLEAIQALPLDFDFILHTGDLCADPLAADYHCARDLLLRFPAPIFLLPGNHDSADMMQDILHDGRHLFVLRDACLPLAGCQLLTIDSNGEGDDHAPTLPDAQIAWLTERLDAIDDGPVLVALHHPLVKTGIPYLDEDNRVQNGERVHQILMRHREKIAAVFYGHIHQAASTAKDGLAYICCPSSWSNLAAYPGSREAVPDLNTAGGFSLVMIDGGTAFVRRCSLPRLAK